MSVVFSGSAAVGFSPPFFSTSTIDLGASLAFDCAGLVLAPPPLLVADAAGEVVTGAEGTAGVVEEVVSFEIILEGATGPTIFVSLAATEVSVEDVAFNCWGWERINDVVFGKAVVAAAMAEREVMAAGTESLSITGGILDVRFCRSCSMTSATFRELASLETGMTATSRGGVPGWTG